MVQSVSNQSTFVQMQRIGQSNDGRVIYQLSDNTGEKSVKMSIAQNDCDKFEKSYNTIMATAPKLQKYAQETTPAEIEKKQKQAKWITWGGAILGALYPLLKIKCNSVWNFVKATLFTALGAGLGMAGGLFVASKVTTPPGAMDFAKATQTLSKLDIQPVNE